MSQNVNHAILRLPAKSAKQVTNSGNVHCKPCNTSSAVVRKQGSSFSTTLAANEMIFTSASKKSGPAGARKVCAVPSPKPVSKEQQAGTQTDLASKFSNQTFAQNSSTNDLSTFSTFSQKNAKIVK